VLAFITPVLLDAGPMVLYAMLTSTVGVGLFLAWLCFRGKQRNEFDAEANMVASSNDDPKLNNRFVGEN